MPTKRREPSNAETPWGNATFVDHFGDGIDFYQTERGGGFNVSHGLNGRVPVYIRNAAGWYESERDWAVVAAVFPDRFTGREMGAAYKTLRDWRPG
jgi:hypothetical protein